MALNHIGLLRRAALLYYLRTFFNDQGFVEVDTPIRQPVFIPESNIVPLSSEGWFLQSSPELCMKRLLAEGEEKIFQICRCFRKGERGRRHLEEFTILEWYRRDCDYGQLMADCESLFRYLREKLAQDRAFAVDRAPCTGQFWRASLEKSWERISVADSFMRYASLSVYDAIVADRFEEIMVDAIEPQLGLSTPTFLYDYPVEMASLAKRKGDNSLIAERFELYLDGMELANGFSELTDVREQSCRFQKEIDIINNVHGGQAIMPYRFLSDLQSLDIAAGIALGVDRLLMLILGEESISNVVSFSEDDFF